MDFFRYLSEIVISAGIINGVLFSILIDAGKKGRSESRGLLKVLLIIFSLIVLRIRYIHPFLTEEFGIPFYVSGPFVFLIGPVFFLYLRVLVTPNDSLSPSDSNHFIPFITYLILFIPSYILGWNSDYAYILRNFVGPPWVFLVIQLIFYLNRIQKLVTSHSKDLVDGYSNVEGLDLSWMKLIVRIQIIVLIFVAVISPTLVHGINVSTYFTVSCVFFTFIQFFVALKAMQQRNLIDWEPASGGSDDQQSVDFNQTKRLLLEFMEKERPYLDPDLTLVGLAGRLGVGRNQLSQVINTGLGDNFYNFINQYRIEEVKRLIKQDSGKKYTIMSLANDAGFNSKSTFNQIFKKLTGTTPSSYRDGLN